LGQNLTIFWVFGVLWCLGGIDRTRQTKPFPNIFPEKVSAKVFSLFQPMPPEIKPGGWVDALWSPLASRIPFSKFRKPAFDIQS
jgi:hypothetical protein